MSYNYLSDEGLTHVASKIKTLLEGKLNLSGGTLTGKLLSTYDPASTDTVIELNYASTTESGAHGIILRPSSTGSEFNGGHGLGVFNASAVDGANIVFFDGGKAASYNLSTHMDFCYRPNAKSWLNFGFYGNNYLMKLDTSGNFHINGDIYEGDTTGNGLGGTVLSSKYHPKTTVDTTATSGSAHLITSGAVYTGLSAKQGTLVSGTNIKTVNGNSLLGSGNITIATGSTSLDFTGSMSSGSVVASYPNLSAIMTAVIAKAGSGSACSCIVDIFTAGGGPAGFFIDTSRTQGNKIAYSAKIYMRNDGEGWVVYLIEQHIMRAAYADPTIWTISYVNAYGGLSLSSYYLTNPLYSSGVSTSGDVLLFYHLYYE